MGVKKVVFVRHGKTNYTNVFPDITSEGVVGAISCADDIMSWKSKGMPLRHQQEPLPIAFITSPAARALGTADVMRAQLRQTRSLIVNDLLRPMDIRDPARAKEVFASLPKGYVSYETTPAFRDPSIFETVDEVAERALDVLRDLPRFMERVYTECAVVVTHYEVISALLRHVFKVGGFDAPSEDEALKNTEPLYLTIEDGCAKFYFREEHFAVAPLSDL